MDNQPITPSNSGPFSSSPNGSNVVVTKSSPILMIFLIILGIGTILFGILTVVFSNKANTATATLEAQKSAAAAKARIEQQQADNVLYTKANESPFRTYEAPPEFGSFVISFPKNWSSSVSQDNSGTQVHLILNPDFLRRTNGQEQPMAVRVMLIQRSKEQQLSQFTGLLKSGKLKQANITVSGQPAFDITGAFNDRKTVRQVVVPIRDKVLVFTTENAKYAVEFGEIIAQAKIVP